MRTFYWYVAKGRDALEGKTSRGLRLRACHAHVLARGRDALEKLEVVVCLHAPLLDPLAQDVERRQVARVGGVQDRHHHLAKSTKWGKES